MSGGVHRLRLHRGGGHELGADLAGEGRSGSYLTRVLRGGDLRPVQHGLGARNHARPVRRHRPQRLPVAGRRRGAAQGEGRLEVSRFGYGMAFRRALTVLHALDYAHGDAVRSWVRGGHAGGDRAVRRLHGLLRRDRSAAFDIVSTEVVYLLEEGGIRLLAHLIDDAGG